MSFPPQDPMPERRRSHNAEVVTRFTDDLGYARCPVCEHQIPASLWCEDCNAYAWEHPPAVTLEEWKARQVPLAELKRNGTTGEWM